MRPRIIDYFNSLFHTGIFQYVIPSITVVYLIMVTTGSVLFIKRCRTDRLNTVDAIWVAVCGSVAGLIGGHIFFLLQNLSYARLHPEVILQLNGDSVSFGVYFGGTLGIVLYSTMRTLPVLKYLDVLVSVLGIGPMIGRIACFLNGDDFGKLSDLPWAVRFPAGSYPFADQVRKGLIRSSDFLSLPVHPVQLYGSLKGLFLFILFSVLWKRNIFKPGVLFLLFLICYSVCRFILEIFRGDNRGFVGFLSFGQYCSLLIFLFSLSCIFIFYRGKIISSRYSILIS